MTLAALQSRVLDRMDELESEVTALRALSGLFNAHHDSKAVNISELVYLVDPIIEREKAIVDEVREMFMTVDTTADKRS